MDPLPPVGSGGGIVLKGLRDQALLLLVASEVGAGGHLKGRKGESYSCSGVRRAIGGHTR